MRSISWLLVGAALVGCHPVTAALVYTPHRLSPVKTKLDPGPLGLALLGVDRQMHVHVGPPEARLCLWIFDPPAGEAPRGTILVLHGYRNAMFWVRGTALGLASRGYRAIGVDLRGHGGSTGDHIGYGAFEARDLMQVVDALRARGEIAGPLGVWGISLGGSVAIQHAAIDPRVACVVSVVPFANLREEASGLIRKAIPVWGWWAQESQVQALVDRATREAGFSADVVDVEESMRHIDAPVLVMGADWDWITPPEHARRLAAAGKRAELIMWPATGHLGTLFDLGGSIQRASAGFFDRRLAVP